MPIDTCRRICMTTARRVSRVNPDSEGKDHSLFLEGVF
jgi:hypothetical protein